MNHNSWREQSTFITWFVFPAHPASHSAVVLFVDVSQLRALYLFAVTVRFFYLQIAYPRPPPEEDLAIISSVSFVAVGMFISPCITLFEHTPTFKQ